MPTIFRPSKRIELIQRLTFNAGSGGSRCLLFFAAFNFTCVFICCIGMKLYLICKCQRVFITQLSLISDFGKHIKVDNQKPYVKLFRVFLVRRFSNGSVENSLRLFKR